MSEQTNVLKALVEELSRLNASIEKHNEYMDDIVVDEPPHDYAEDNVNPAWSYRDMEMYVEVDDSVDDSPTTRNPFYRVSEWMSSFLDANKAR